MCVVLLYVLFRCWLSHCSSCPSTTSTSDRDSGSESDFDEYGFSDGNNVGDDENGPENREAGAVAGVVVANAAFVRGVYGVVGVLVLVLFVLLLCSSLSITEAAVALALFASAMVQFGLMFGVSEAVIACKVQDVLIGHFIFLPLFVLSALHLPSTLQTWLLFYNALSQGVVIEDVLRQARQRRAVVAAGDRGGGVVRQHQRPQGQHQHQHQQLQQQHQE